MKIGFIGLGIMGTPMAINIIKNGYEVYGFDIDKNKIVEFVKSGGKEANSYEDLVNNSDVIITMLPNTSIFVEVINKLKNLFRRGQILIDMSTISYKTSRDISSELRKIGVEMLDAPVVKSQPAAIKGELGILVGGRKEIFEKIYDILKCMGKEIIYYGENGNGLKMKILHNMLVAGIQLAVNETLILAQKSGLNFDDVIKGIKAGGGQNFYLDAKIESIKNKDFSPKFPFEHMYKDLNLALELSKEYNIEPITLKETLKIYKEGIEKNLNREDFSATIKILEEKYIKN
ncbi:MAG: NAD(P)-dependent oxidoreductase [Spirochaetes bacterium]|nr:NAD(P)-dependent oxidoreductase [Spirochaetota bacterium]